MSLVLRKCNTNYNQLVSLIVLIYLVTTATKAAAGEPQCRLEPATNATTRASGLGAVCDTNLDGTTKTFYLNNCVSTTKAQTPPETCADLLSRKKYCFLQLEIKHFASFAGLTLPNDSEERSQCSDGIVKISLYLTTVDIGTRNGTKLFQYYPINHEVSKLVMRHVKLYKEMKMDEFVEFQFGSKQLNKLRFIEFYDMKFEDHFPEKCDSFETIGVYHSLVPKVNTFTFKMDMVNLRKVEMVDVEMLDEKGFQEHPFSLAAAHCYHNGTKTLEIIFRNMQLKHEVIKSSLVKDFWIISNCTGRLILNATVTGNVFDRTIPEPVFKELFEITLKRKETKLLFEFDPIDCCFRTNSWLFPILFAHANKTDGIGIHCDDLGIPLSQIRNNTQLNQSCYQRNVFPIYMIAIVSILLLALLLGVFSFVCIYHILPSKNQEIMLNNNQAQSSGFKNSSTEIPKTKVSSAIEAQSTQTEVPGKSVPLLSKSITQFKQHKGSLKGLKSPKKLSSPSDELVKTTLRSSRQQQVVSQLKATKSPTSLMKGKRHSSGDGKEKKVLNLNKVVYKLPGYKNREAKHYQKRGKHHKDEVLGINKKPSLEKSPQSPVMKGQSRDRSPNSPTNSKTAAAVSPAVPIKPPPQPVVLPKPIKAPSVIPLDSTTATEKTVLASKTQAKQVSAPTKADSKGADDAMSLAFKTINL